MKFSGLIQKIATFWTDPAHAPLTEPLNMIARAAYVPIRPFVEDIRDAYEDTYSDGPLLKRMFARWGDNTDNIGVFAAGTFGAAIGGVAAAVAGGIAAFSMSGGSIALTALGALGALGVGAVATPFVIMGALGIAGAAVGLVGTPYALVKGLMKAQEHRQFLKTQGAVVAAVPQLQAQGPEAKEKATELFEILRGLDSPLQDPVMKALNERFAATASGAAAKIVKAIDVLPEEERKALVQELRGRLAETFEKVATAEAEDATHLQRRIKPLDTIRFAPKKGASNAKAGAQS